MFALIADQASNIGGSEGSKLDFAMFTGITAFLITLGFMILYLMDMQDNSVVTLTELVINVIWWIFWLAAAACLSDLVANSIGTSSKGQDEIAGSCACAWIAWASWTVSTYMSVREVMAGRGISSGGGAGPSAMPMSGAASTSSPAAGSSYF